MALGSQAAGQRRRALRVRTGDEVKVIAGKDKGKQGKVLRVEPRKERVFVEGINIVKRHMRPQQTRDKQGERAVGGVVEREGPVHVSNVMLVDPKDGKATRVGVEHEDGKRFRVAKRSGMRLD